MAAPSSPVVPTFDTLMVPTLKALQALGGSGSVEEIYQQVVQSLNLSDQVLAIAHGQTSQSELEYRLAWSRTYLKQAGWIQNSTRGIWALTQTELNWAAIDPKQIVKTVRSQKTATSKTRAIKSDSGMESPSDSESGLGDAGVEDSLTEIAPEDALAALETNWQESLHETLLALSPAAFERLVQRLLRESGFVQVQVTGKSGDGGIDGVGIARINGFLSFHVLFQCKRYQGSVGASQVRDFRGAMQGRTDKGLLITTGSFTREAMREATRDGAPPIDLIDGEQLVQRLKDLGLGVRVTMVEMVTVDQDWFSQI